MKLLNIKLKNFLCYSGEDNEINFTDGLNLILGANGYGKSKLYDAFNWVFFDGITNQTGKRVYTATLKSNLVSKQAIEATKEGKVECKVIIELAAQNEEYLIERRYFVQKDKKGKILEADKSTVTVFIKTDKEFLPYDLPIDSGFVELREKIIPTDILQHIWFQGERGITKAVDTSNGKTLLQVINKISYIDMWQHYINVADSGYKRMKTNFDNEVRKSSKKEKERKKLQSEIEKLDKSITKNTKELSTRREEFSKIQNKIDKIKLSKEAQTRLNQFKEVEGRLRREKEQVAKRLDEMIDTADRNLFDEFWVIHGTQHSANRFDKLYQEYIYEKQRELEDAQGTFPKIPRGNPTTTHIRKMLDDCHCHVCDRAAPKDSDAYKKIERLLPQNYPTISETKAKYVHDITFKTLSNVQIGLELNIDFFHEKSTNAIDEYFQLEQERVDLEEKIANTTDQKNLVLSDLGLDSIESGIHQGKSYNSLEQQLLKLSNTIGRLESQILIEKDKKDELEQKYRKVLGSEVKDETKIQLEYFSSLQKATKDAKESQLNQLVELLQSKTNEHYENINKRSGAFYGDIRFHKNTTEGYTAKIHNIDEEDITDNMNTSQILSMQLSILFAILSTNKEKGLNKKYPLIADAPNSSFDPEKRKYLLREMGETFDQSIIMMFEYLEKDPNRENRYRINTKALKGLKTEMKEANIDVNIVHLDIPDGINPKQLQDLSIDIKAI